MFVVWGVAAALSYLVGTLPTAQLVSRHFGHDPLREGSGNPGASNVYRTAGRSAGAMVLVGDVAKGALPTLTALIASGRPLATLCFIAAVVGHVVPVTRWFRGGKGVATAGGGALVLHPLVGVGLLVVFVAVVRLWRISSVGSLTMAGLFPVLVALRGRSWWEVVAAIAVSGLVVIRHRTNVRRLLAGTEQPLPG